MNPEVDPLKRVYMVQATNSSEGTYMLPYSTGTLVAYAWADERVKNNYEMCGFIFRREHLEAALEEIRDPDIVGFSNNLWNSNFNKALAERVKEKYPQCIIFFGGKELPLDATYLEQYPYIDYLIHLWGEIPFRKLLLALLEEQPDFARINNISYRCADGKCCTTPLVSEISPDFPSPYLTGVFDKLYEENPDVYFVAGFESNRGCPFHCTYCDWDTKKDKFVEFPLEKIFAEIEWIATHKVDYCGCFDSNFGLLPRDELIVDKLVEVKTRTGFPHKLQVSAAKADNDRVFRINKKMNDIGMSKGVTLSMQSLCPEALKNVDRKNISLERYSELLVKYKTEGIPTFTDIILGLPGETYESFCRGLCRLLEAGQHSTIFIYACNLLTNSILWRERDNKRFQIKTVDIPFYQAHCNFINDEEITEYSKEIIGTSTMSTDEFNRAKFFGHILQCFHCFGLLQSFAIYLFYEHNVPYYDFYSGLDTWLLGHPDSVAGRIFLVIKNQLQKYAEGKPLEQYVDPVFGNITWPFEEGAYLEILLQFDRFYEEIYDYLKAYGIDPAVYGELLAYQKRIIKYPGKTEVSREFGYDFCTYFKTVFAGHTPTLKKTDCIVTFRAPEVPDNWKDYSKYVVWFGRKGKGNVCTDISVSYPDR